MLNKAYILPNLEYCSPRVANRPVFPRYPRQFTLKYSRRSFNHNSESQSHSSRNSLTPKMKLVNGSLISPAIIILASLGPRIGLACSKQSDKNSGIQCPRKLIWRMIYRSEATQYSRRIRCSANAPDTFETVTRTGKRLICK